MVLLEVIVLILDLQSSRIKELNIPIMKFVLSSRIPSSVVMFCLILYSMSALKASLHLTLSKGFLTGQRDIGYGGAINF